MTGPRGSSSAILSKYSSLPVTRHTHSSTAARLFEPQYTVSRHLAPSYTAGETGTQRSATPTARVQQLQQAYGEPVSRSTSSVRSVSVGRRPAAETLPKTLSSGIASLGSRPRSTSTTRAATVSRTISGSNPSSSSSNSTAAGCSSSLTSQRRDVLASQNSFNRRGDADVASSFSRHGADSSSASGRSSLFGSSRSQSQEDEGSVVRAQAVTDGRPGLRMPLAGDMSSASSSGRPGLSRCVSALS